MARDNLLHGTGNNSNKKIEPFVPLVITYGTGMPNITKILKECWPTILQSPLAKRVVGPKPMVAYRRAPNLKEKIVRAKVEYPPQPQPARSNWQEPRYTCPLYVCNTCKQLRRNAIFTCPNTGKMYHLPTHHNCSTRNVIYLLYCEEHNAQYVGETSRAFSIRLTEHMADIRRKRDTPVSHHYNNRSHTRHNPKVYILEHLDGDPVKFTRRQKRREYQWIQELRSFTPYGITKKGK